MAAWPVRASFAAGERPATWRDAEAWALANGYELGDQQRDAPRIVYRPPWSFGSSKWRNVRNAADADGIAVLSGLLIRIHMRDEA